MEKKIWHFLCTRKHIATPDVQIAFRVYGYNIFNATNMAYKRVIKAATEQVDLFNSDYDNYDPYELILNENMLSVSIIDTRKHFSDSCIFFYSDFELINEQEYDSLPKEVWKDYM